MTARRRFRVRLRWIALAAAVGVPVVLVYALLSDPGWYDPPIIAREDRQLVRNSLIAAEQAFTEALLTRAGPFVYHVHQDELNRWLAMRREIYPLADQLTPPVIADPFVRFDQGRIVVAGRYTGSRLRPIVSLSVRLAFEDGTIVLRAEGTRVGGVPAPAGWFGVRLDRPVDRAAEKTWPGSPRIWGDLQDGLRIGARAWWKNGGSEYRVRKVWVEPGVLHFEIEPLGSHFAGRDSAHKGPDPSR